MKIVAILLSIFTLGSFAFAQDSSSAIEMPAFSNSTTTNNFEQIEKDEPNWNISLGMSQFERGDVYDFKGNGITIEVQRRLGNMFALGASYTNYSTESKGSATYSYDGYAYTSLGQSRRPLDVFTASIEAHPIRVELEHQSEFFAAIVGGLMGSAQEDSGMNNPYYGAGIGVNYNNQMGIRADLKSNRDFRAFSSFALIGYY